MNAIISCVGNVLFAIIIIITAVAPPSIVLESGIINVSYAQILQRSPSTGSEVTTPGANPMCDPTDTSINTTESHVCGIPKTPSGYRSSRINNYRTTRISITFITKFNNITATTTFRNARVTYTWIAWFAITSKMSSSIGDLGNCCWCYCYYEA